MDVLVITAYRVRAVPTGNGRAGLLWMNRTIATFDNLASAKVTAKAFNRCLSRMVRAGMWSVENVQQAMVQWMLAAGGGVPGASRPVLGLSGE